VWVGQPPKTGEEAEERISRESRQSNSRDEEVQPVAGPEVPVEESGASTEEPGQAADARGIVEDLVGDVGVERPWAGIEAEEDFLGRLSFSDVNFDPW
jgi:hypothetical protein